jgi:hypothetical protein
VTPTAAASFSTPAWREALETWSKAISLAEARTRASGRRREGNLAAEALLAVEALRRADEPRRRAESVVGMVAMPALPGV